MPEQGTTGRTAEVPAETEKSGPDIGVTPTKERAIAYSYEFRLPITQLAAVQEADAVRCEALGAARCNITGMTYRAYRNREISASLALELDPTVARVFGRDGIGAAVKAGGMLVSSEITSQKVGDVVRDATTADRSIEAERMEINRQLAQSGLAAVERSDLQRRLAELADAGRAVRQQGASAALAVTTTPMAISYSSGVVDSGFSDGPMLSAVKDGWGNLIGGTAAIVTFVITLLPLALLLGGCVWAWRRFASRLPSA